VKDLNHIRQRSVGFRIYDLAAENNEWTRQATRTLVLEALLIGVSPLAAFALLQSNTGRKSTECSTICGILRPLGGRELTGGEILLENELGDPW